MTMIQESTLKFLRDLKKNNDRAWMEKNKPRYINAKSDFESLVARLIPGIAGFDPAIASLEVKDCTFRLYRDVRFSKDKSPYKTNMGASFNPGGKKQPTPGYYIHIEPGQSFVAGGLWMPEALPLARLRQEIDYNYDQWKSVISSAQFRKYFPEGMDKEDTLQRPPKGYEADNPAIEFLKLKSFTTRHFLSDKEITNPGTYKTVLEICKSIRPLLEFINHAIAE